MHDAWLALIASCFGEIGWVDRPLYYYRQHGGNTLGAEKGDNLESVRDRVKDGSSAGRITGRCLVRRIALPNVWQLSEPGTAETLEAFIRLRALRAAGKMGLMVKYGFYQKHPCAYTGADAVH
ncbi:MAG: hypothetical protein ACLR0U_33295 [Enterocloster clostridioformis]